MEAGVTDNLDGERHDTATSLLAESEASREELERVLERISDAFVALDTQWRYTYMNDIAGRIFNRTPAEMIGKHIWTEFPEAVDQPFYEAYYRAIEIQQPVFIEEYYAPYDRWFENRIYPSPDGLTIFFTDVTERKHSELELRRINRAHRVLTATNQALVRADDEIDLLHDVCRICVDVGGYRMAWVGYARDDERRTVEPMAQAGVVGDYLDNADIVWSNTDRGNGPTGKAIRERRPVSVSDISVEPAYTPWRKLAETYGISSSVAIPLIHEGRVIGALNIYSNSPASFEGQELQLLSDLAGDLAFGITALRARTERDAVAAENARLLGGLLQSANWPPPSAPKDV